MDKSPLAWLTPPIVAAGTGSKMSRAAEYLQPLARACELYEISTPTRIAAFFAQIGHESMGLERLRESLDYAANRLVAVFGKHRITEPEAMLYGRTDEHDADQEAIANLVYGGDWGLRKLGNTQPGDGWKFRGAGLMHHTGRANAILLRDRLRKRMEGVPDFEAEPHLIATAQWAPYGAADFWGMRGLNALADTGDFESITLRINGGLNGYDDRLKRWRAGKAAMANLYL